MAGTVNNTINAAASPTLTFASGSPTGSITAGGVQTIVDCTPINVTSPAASVTTVSSVLTWTNPSCYDEILIVAATTSNTGTPTGDGTAYVGNLTYSSGTTLGNGFVVYKGSTSSQTVTGLTNGTPYFYKFFTRRGTTWSAGTEVSATPVLTSTASDHFRSVVTGDWATAGTWESSSDNVNWITATLAPTSSANTITIQNGHTITISSTVTIDQVIINNGGILSHAGGILLTIADGAGDDITVENGGIFRHAGASAVASFGATTAVFRIKTGGMIEVTSGTGSGGTYANDAGTVAFQQSIIWEDGAIFNWNNANTFPATTRVYFPQVNSSTIPIFRLSAISGTPGGAGNLTINGKFDVRVNFTFAGAGIKTFRNGIIGTATMSQSTTGQWIISGATAVLGSGVSLSLGTNGLTINNSSAVTSSGSLTVTGGTVTVSNSATLNITENQSIESLTVNAGGVTVTDSKTLTLSGTLTLTSGNITLGTNGTGSVVISTGGTLSGGSANSYIVTVGTGGLTRPITASVASYLFPVGSALTYRPATVNFTAAPSAGTIKGRFVSSSPSSTGLPITEGTSTITNISPTGYWEITSAISNGTYTMTVDASGFKKVDNTTAITSMSGIRLIKRPTGGSWTATTTTTTSNPASLSAVSSAGLTGFSDFAIGGSDAVLAVELTKLIAKTSNNQNLLTWQTATEQNSSLFNIERSTNGQTNWTTIGTVKAAGNSPNDKRLSIHRRGPPQYQLLPFAFS